MATEFDSRVTELLCARLCHDLIGPVAAIGNGVELVTEFGDGMQGEALTLIGDSAARASNLLQFYRVAFGSARKADGSGIGLAEARERALAALASERIALHWPPVAGSAFGALGPSRLTVKLILNLVLLGTEVLPGSGEVTVDVASGGEPSVGVTARKAGLVLDPDLSAVLAGDVARDDLTPRTVQPHLVRVLAETVGRGLGVRETPSGIEFSVAISPAS